MKTISTLEFFNFKRRRLAISNNYAIILVITGSIEIEHNNTIYHLSEDDIFVLNPYDETAFFSLEYNIVLMLIIDRNKIEEMIEESWTLKYISDLSSVSEERRLIHIRKEILNIIRAFYEKRNYYEMYINQITLGLINYLSDKFADDSVSKDIIQGKIEDKRIADILNYINKNYFKDLSLNDISKEHYISLPHLSRIFKKQVGLTFTDYLNEVRLKNIMTELPRSDESILKIVLSHGFSNLKSFYNVYNKHYDTPPSAYRQNSTPLHKKSTEENDFQILAIDKAINQLSKKLVLSTGQIINPQTTKYLSLNIGTSRNSGLSIAKKIIKAGYGNIQITSTIKEEIEELNERIGFDYILFALNAEKLESPNLKSKRKLDLFLWLDFVLAQRLIPIFRLEFKPKESRNFINFFIECSNRYGNRQMENWHILFEFASSKDNETDCMLNEYFIMYKRLKFLNPYIKLGIDSISSLNEGGTRIFSYIYNNLVRLCCEPDFVTYSAIYSEMNDIREKDENFYQEINRYPKKVLERLNFLLRSLTEKEPEIFLDEWNTLSSSNEVVAGTFYRTALITKSILDLSDKVSAISFWLSAGIENVGKDSLCLYLYGLLKKPVFFLLELINKIGDEILLYDNDILLSKNNDEYQLLLMNPCYIDPSYSIDKYIIDNNRISLSIVLRGFEKENREYAIKKYTLDKDHGGIYNEQLKLGSIEEFDNEFQSYLERIVTPKIEIIKEEINYEFTVNTNLTINAIEIYNFKKLNTIFM